MNAIGLICCIRNRFDYLPSFGAILMCSNWRTWFGKTHDIPNPPGPNLPGRAKGFLQMVLGTAGQAPVIASERNAL
jgi:hypothetical protein